MLKKDLEHGRWDDPNLTDEQKEYAAADAYAGLWVAWRLHTALQVRAAQRVPRAAPLAFMDWLALESAQQAKELKDDWSGPPSSYRRLRRKEQALPPVLRRRPPPQQLLQLPPLPALQRPPPQQPLRPPPQQRLPPRHDHHPRRNRPPSCLSPRPTWSSVDVRPASTTPGLRWSPSSRPSLGLATKSTVHPLRRSPPTLHSPPTRTSSSSGE